MLATNIQSAPTTNNQPNAGVDLVQEIARTISKKKNFIYLFVDETNFMRRNRRLIFQ